MSSMGRLKEIKEVLDYADQILCIVFPGLFLLETIYHKGLFAGGVSSPYDFIMFLFWCIGISIIYLHTAFITISIEDVVEKHFKATEGQTSTKKEKEEQEKRVYSLYIPPLMILTVLTYIVFNSIKYFIVTPEKVFIILIPSTHMVFMLSFLITFICSYPIGCFYRKALDKIISSNDRQKRCGHL